MQEKNFSKFNKQILCILILSVIIYIIDGVIPQLINKSYAVTYTYTNASNDLSEDFDTKYPGYKSLLQSLSSTHPKWTFKLYETGLDWETVINSEYQGHGSSPSNLVPSDYSAAWICSICGTRNYDTSGRWYCASRGAIEHVMDPRNSLNEANIFQYLLLSNDKNITEEQVTTMASKISYLNDPKLISAIYEVANNPEYNINPFYIIGKILQEQGSGASALCSGQGYNNQYIGYYNLFNVGASGNTTEEVILNGLSYAQSQGWDTPQKSIMGGIGLIRSYINRGQDTLYYQKFNVTYSPYFKNQYAQNIFDSQSIGSILKGYYKEAELLDSEFIFEIPLYNNMPSEPVKNPILTSETGELAYVNANGGLSLRASPNGEHLTYISEGTQVLITERATEKVGDYYWDKVSTPKGTGYMARGSSTKVWLVVIKKYEISETNIIVDPGANISNISGATNNSSTFGTGSTITLNGNTYTLVMLGDTNGDGKIDSADLLKIVRHLKGTSTISIETCADPNRDGKIDSADLLKIVRHLKGTSIITL